MSCWPNLKEGLLRAQFIAFRNGNGFQENLLLTTSGRTNYEF
jgi:hypothetical protein